MTNSDADFLSLADEWIARAASDEGLAWFRGVIRDVRHNANDRALAVAIGLAPRKLGKADLALSPGDVARAEALRAGLDPGDWSVDQLARIALMAARFNGSEEEFARQFDLFCTTAEIHESIALYKGLPLYPGAALIEPRAREAVRSGMKPVFEAVAHRNPYPGEIFSEDAWNHMVVKAFFIGSSLWPIQNLDRRSNPHLARMLVGLAQERWAAGRQVSGELWRCVVPHADDEGTKAIEYAFAHGQEKDRLAIALAMKDLATTDIAERISFQDDLPTLQARLKTENIGWSDLAS